MIRELVPTYILDWAGGLPQVLVYNAGTFTFTYHSACVGVGGITITGPDPLCDAELRTSLCLRWCPIVRRHDWQPRRDRDCNDQKVELVSSSVTRIVANLSTKPVTTAAAGPQWTSLKMIFATSPDLV